MPCSYCPKKKSEEQDFQKHVIQGSEDYLLHGSLGNRTIYWAGREVLVTQEPLPAGLGGFTDTRNSITLAPDNQIKEDFANYSMSMDQHIVLGHELRHFGIHDEYLNRMGDFVEQDIWKVRAAPALDTISLHYDDRPFEEETNNSSVVYRTVQDK